ncbi:MAG: LTA synthase family protein [Spirochaetia bacterium]|nr:LTA synthase family protein [Spirochaetia bacterium]
MILSKFLFLFFHRALTNDISYFDVFHSILYGMKYDLSAAAMCSASGIFLVFISHRYFRLDERFSVRFSLILTAIIALIIFIADSIYFEEAQRHLGYEVTNFLTDPIGLTNFIFSRYWFIIIIYTAIFVFSLAYLFYKINPNISIDVEKKSNISKSIVFPEIQLLLISLISIIMIRGGVQAFPLEPIHVNHLGNSSKASLALNGLYNAVYYSFKPHAQNYMKKPDDFNESELKSILSEMYSEPFKIPVKNGFQKYNIVIIFLESWDAYHMKSYGNKNDVTPNFDRLRKQSLTTDYMFSGGTRTSEGLFASLCSYPNPLGQAIVKTTLEQHKYNCLPEILANDGYHNYFFQGTSEKLARTGDFVRKLGFHESYGEEDIKNPKLSKNWFGVHDPDLYDFIISKISEMKEPFIIGINTGTTHDLKLPNGVSNRFSDLKENVMSFADEAIPLFLNEYKKNTELYNRTIFIMLADHTSHASVSNFNRYSIPFLIYAPGIIKPQKINIVASQRDVAPTIFDILNRPVPNSFAGKSILQKDINFRFAEYYHNGMLGWVEKDILVELSLFSKEKPLCYMFRFDKDMKKPVLCSNDIDKITARAKYFTYNTQDLLFSGKTFQFKKELFPH